MTVLQTIGVYALIPLAVYGVLSLFTLWPKIARGPRYRPGQEWSYEPMWWTGNPVGTGPPAVPPADRGLPVGWSAGSTRSTDQGTPRASTARGGARGSW